MTVHTLDARHKLNTGGGADQTDADASEEDKRLRLSFAANVSGAK